MLKNFRKGAAKEGCLPHDQSAFKLFIDALSTPKAEMSVEFKKDQLVWEPDGEDVQRRDVLSIALPAGLVEERSNDPDKLREELYRSIDVFIGSMTDRKE